MQVISGPIGRQKVHYEAPPAARVPEEMDRFLSWLEAPGNIDPLLIAGLAHLCLSPSTLSMTATGASRARSPTWRSPLRTEPSAVLQYVSANPPQRNDYYTMLERTQKGALDVTPWQEWFLSCLHRAIESSQGTLGAVLEKARFWERFAQHSLNERQMKVLNRLLDGFEGKLTTSKWPSSPSARRIQPTATSWISWSAAATQGLRRRSEHELLACHGRRDKMTHQSKLSRGLDDCRARSNRSRP